jgi:hypothetical protein
MIPDQTGYFEVQRLMKSDTIGVDFSSGLEAIQRLVASVRGRSASQMVHRAASESKRGMQRRKVSFAKTMT